MMVWLRIWICQRVWQMISTDVQLPWVIAACCFQNILVKGVFFGLIDLKIKPCIAFKVCSGRAGLHHHALEWISADARGQGAQRFAEMMFKIWRSGTWKHSETTWDNYSSLFTRYFFCSRHYLTTWRFSLTCQKLGSLQEIPLSGPKDAAFRHYSGPVGKPTYALSSGCLFLEELDVPRDVDVRSWNCRTRIANW